MSYVMNREAEHPAFMIDENGETVYPVYDSSEDLSKVTDRVAAFFAQKAEAERIREQELQKERDQAAVRRAARGLPFAKKLIFEVADELGLKVEMITGKGRSRPFVHARALISILLKEKDTSRYSYPQIGRILGGRDHSTVIHAVENFDVYCRLSPGLWELYKALGGKRNA